MLRRSALTPSMDCGKDAEAWRSSQTKLVIRTPTISRYSLSYSILYFNSGLARLLPAPAAPLCPPAICEADLVKSSWSSYSLFYIVIIGCWLLRNAPCLLFLVSSSILARYSLFSSSSCSWKKSLKKWSAWVTFIFEPFLLAQSYW